MTTTLSLMPSPSIQLARSLGPLVTVDALQSMSAYDLFVKQLESGSTEASMDAMKRLSVVAKTMGAEQARTVLVPYLTALAQQQPPPVDELLLVLGQELPAVCRLVGSASASTGGVSNAEELFLPMLERLAAVEETVVREQAVVVIVELAKAAGGLVSQTSSSSSSSSGAASASTTADAASAASTAADGTTTTAATTTPSSTSASAAAAPSAPVWMAMIKRLAAADWFTPKVSAAGIIASLFYLVPPTDYIELLNLYKELCVDETPMVRRAAAKHLGSVLAVNSTCSSSSSSSSSSISIMQRNAVHQQQHRDFCLYVLPRLAADEQDSVRRLAVAAIGEAGTSYGENTAWTAQHWLSLVKDGATDMSWRVRHNLSKHFSNVATNLGIQNDPRLVSEQSLVMACFVSLLTDVEAEVRAAAVGHLARMVAWGGATHFENHLQALLPALADDVVMEVRSKCALALMDAADGGTLDDAVILSCFGPLLESFLQDEFHEVQLQVLTNLHKIARLLPGLGGVVTTLLQMSKASNWRVRESVAKLLPHLAEARGLDFFVSVLLEPAWMTLLLDPVASVRKAIVQGMPLLVQVAGEDWIRNQLLPQHVAIYNQNSSSYLIRITLLQGHVHAATVASAGNPLQKDLLEHILRALKDKVPNVRMVAARGLYTICSSDKISPADNIAVTVGQILPALESAIQEEDDVDVRQACQLALDKMK